MATHKYGSDSYTARGLKTEKNFIEKCKELGYSVEEATKQENIMRHTDCYINGYSCDVKDRTSHKIICELEVGGRPGWVYSHTKYISFYLSDIGKYYIVEREQLALLIKQNNYKVWGRRQYDEKLCTIPLNDLINITKRVL